MHSFKDRYLVIYTVFCSYMLGYLMIFHAVGPSPALRSGQVTARQCWLNIKNEFWFKIWVGGVYGTVITQNNYHSIITQYNLHDMVWRNVREALILKHIKSSLIVIPTCTFCSLTSVHHLTICVANSYFVSKMCVRMGQSLRGGPHILPSSLFFINQNLCVGSGVRTFSAPFCAYATFINETLEPLYPKMTYNRTQST